MSGVRSLDVLADNRSALPTAGVPLGRGRDTGGLARKPVEREGWPARPLGLSRHEAKMPLGTQHPAASSQGAAEPDSLTILVADDEPVVRTTIGRILKTHGCRVLQAVDGVHALEIAAQHPGPIHLLLTDIEMPRLDGHELHRRLNRQRPETRTLFMSGALETGLHPSAAFLPKPFAARALVLKVCEALQILELSRNPAMRKEARG